MNTKVTSNMPLVVARLGQIAGDQRKAVAKGLRRGLELTRSMSQRDYLSGPRPTRLGVVTTRLRNSMTTRVQDTGNAIEGIIGTNVPYAPFHEFGFHGAIQVRAHTRISGATAGAKLNLRKLRGPIYSPVMNSDGIKVGKQLVGHRRSARTVVGDLSHGVVNIQMVKAHERHVDYSGRPFIRPAIYRMLPKIGELVIAELKRHIRDSGAGGQTA